MENISETNKGGFYGWICPVCGRGNSPFTSTCPCKPLDIKITCSSTYEKSLDHYYNTGVK